VKLRIPLLLLPLSLSAADCREDPHRPPPAAASAPASATTAVAPATTPAQVSEPGAVAADAPLEPDTTRMRIGSKTFTLEIAERPSEQERGLMHRRSMPADRGMIFVFEDAEERAFWMKNTLIPLDILYLAADGRVISIKHMAPLDVRGVPSDGPAMYAIELNLSAAEQAGVKPGDRLTIPPEVLRLQDR